MGTSIFNTQYPIPNTMENTSSNETYEQIVHDQIDYTDKSNFITPNSTLHYGKNLSFDYINTSNIVFDKSSTDYEKPDDIDEPIFKHNLFLITESLRKYYPDLIINITFDCPTNTELILCELNEYSNCTNVNINIGTSNKQYYCGFNYFVDLPQTELFDASHVDSMVQMDYYKYYVRGEQYGDWLKACVMRLLIICCSIENDEYGLAEIMLENASVTEMEKFRKIMNGKKSTVFNIRNWYGEILPVNPTDGHELTYDEFITLMNELNEEPIEFIGKNIIHFCVWEKILMKIDDNYSPAIGYYKTVYLKAMDMLMNALRTIIELVVEINKSKKYIPQYINNFLRYRVKYYNDKDVLEILSNGNAV